MSSIGGAIVTFHPDAEFRSRLEAIRREVDRLIIVDNSATPETHAQLAALCALHGAELLAQPENLGLGAALNTAFSQLAEAGYIWAIAFDQDSTPAPGFATTLRAVAGRGATAAVVGANWFDEARPQHDARHLMRSRVLPFLFRRLRADSDLEDVTCVITSGALFHLPTWRTVGMFDAALFLDLVDTEYCLRAARAGHPIRVAADAKLTHRRGAKRPVSWLGRTWWPAFMSPLRLRYLFRNRCRVARRHALWAPHWCMFELVYAAKIVGEILLFENEKRAKLAACIRGTWDGLRRRTGRIDVPSDAEKTSAVGTAP